MGKVLIFLLLLLPSQTWGACTFNAASTQAEATSGNITLNTPASPATNDIWIAVIHSRDAVAHSLTDWTQLLQNSPFSNHNWSIWWFRYAGSNPNLVVTHTAGASILGGIAQLRGCDTAGSPVDTQGTATDAQNNATVTYSTITPATSNTLLLAIASVNNNVVMNPDPSGFSVGFELVGSTGSFPNAVFLHHKAHVSGATGGFTATAGSATTENSGILIAIQQQVTRRPITPITFSGD